MTLLDMIKLGLIKTHREAERFAADLVDLWHADRLPGELHDVLGLTDREYQAWTTGGVSLLTIARRHQTGQPPLDLSRAWFKLSGAPGKELVGYLQDRPKKRRARKKVSRS